MATRGVGFLMPQPPTLDSVPPKANMSESPGNSATSLGLKSGFRKSFILQALYAYRSNKDPTGKELIRAIEKHPNELLHNIPHEGNILHELVRRGHTRKGLVDIIMPKYPVAARAYEWKPDGTKMSLLRHAVEKKDRGVIEAIITATEHLLAESDKCVNFGEREDLFLELLDLEDWFEVLTEYPSLIDLHSVKAIFSLQPSAADVVSDEPGWRAHIGPAELKIQGSDVPFPVNFWPVAVCQKLPSLLSRQTIRLMATPRTNNMTNNHLSGTSTANLSNSHHHHLLGASGRSGVNADYYNTYSIDQSRYHHILPEATGVEVEPSLIGFPDAMRPGPRSLLQLCVDLCERTGRTSTFELEIVSAILQYKWNAFGRPIYKFCLIVSTLLAINYSLSSALIDRLLFSEDRSVRVLAYVWQAAIWINGVPLLCQEGLQLTSQGVVQYFSEAWNMLDVLSLLLVYATTIWRFFLPAGNTPYLLLSAFAALLLWAKLLAYLRGFHETGALVRMIFQIMIDMRYFLVVLAISIAGFGNCLYLIFRSDIEREGATNITAIKHSYGSLFHTYLVLFFALNSNLDYEPIDVSSHKLLAALVYVMYCMTTTILLLNLLIAIMSDSYDKVQEHAAAQGRYEQALAIIEIESMLPGIILDDERFFPRWVQVLRARRTGESAAADADQWSGRIRQISKKIDASEAKLASQMESLDGRLSALLQHAVSPANGLLGLANATARRTLTPDPYTHNMGLGEPQEGGTGMAAATAMLGLEGQSSPRPLRLPDEASLLAPADEKKADGDGYRTPPTSRFAGTGAATATGSQGREGPSLMSSVGTLALPSTGAGGGGEGPASPNAGVRALEVKVASLESKIDLILAKLSAT